MSKVVDVNFVDPGLLLVVVNAGGGGDPEGFGWDDGVVGVRILIMLLKKFVKESSSYGSSIWGSNLEFVFRMVFPAPSLKCVSDKCRIQQPPTLE